MQTFVTEHNGKMVEVHLKEEVDSLLDRVGGMVQAFKEDAINLAKSIESADATLGHLTAQQAKCLQEHRDLMERYK